jgi:hypothetical protein
MLLMEDPIAKAVSQSMALRFSAHNVPIIEW